jgi:hypothetical protein
MPAPYRPSTAAATAARRRSGQDTKAAALASAGWICLPPEAYRDIVISGDTTAGTVTVHCRTCGQAVVTHAIGGCNDQLDTLLAAIISHAAQHRI